MRSCWGLPWGLLRGSKGGCRWLGRPGQGLGGAFRWDEIPVKEVQGIALLQGSRRGRRPRGGAPRRRADRDRDPRAGSYAGFRRHPRRFPHPRPWPGSVERRAAHPQPEWRGVGGVTEDHRSGAWDQRPLHAGVHLAGAPRVWARHAETSSRRVSPRFSRPHAGLLRGVVRCAWGAVAPDVAGRHPGHRRRWGFGLTEAGIPPVEMGWLAVGRVWSAAEARAWPWAPAPAPGQVPRHGAGRKGWSRAA